MGAISSLGIGSGLDLNGLLGQLEDAEREKLVPIEEQVETEQTKISAYGQLESGLAEFQDSASALADGSLFESLSTNVSGEAVSAAADETAMPGSYNVTVDSLATRGTLASAGVADDMRTVGEQKMTFTFGTDSDTSETTETSVTIADDSSLEDIRDTINADESAGLNATIINDGNENRLALSSRETGEDASISEFSFDGTEPFSSDAGTHQAGSDAGLNVNGIDIASSTNQVEGAVQGVTLSLQSEGTSTVAVEQDTRAVREAVTSFVEGFNALKSTTAELTAFDQETGEAGPLNGDSAVRTAESQLRGVLSGGVASEGDGFSMLSQVGISLEVDGTLSLDENKLSDVVANDQQALSDFFVGTENNPGIATQVDASVEQLLGSSGAVQGAISSSESSVESLSDRYTSMEQSIGQTIDRYRTQFGELDGMVSEMNQTSNYLTQQLGSMGAQTGG
ncbi:MAG: flagellar filament capping protein FliD [Pseudomonadota bacterium]